MTKFQFEYPTVIHSYVYEKLTHHNWFARYYIALLYILNLDKKKKQSE